MKKAKWFFLVLFLVILGASGFICIFYYGYVFARTVTGEVIAVQRVPLPNTVISTSPSDSLTPPQMFSFAVAIKEKSGEIVTASSEDRQWAVVSPGQCAQAKFYPYPPWDFEKSGTYHGARLLMLHECPK